jgi:hypothetical protein
MHCRNNASNALDGAERDSTEGPSPKSGATPFVDSRSANGAADASGKQSIDEDTHE